MEYRELVFLGIMVGIPAFVLCLASRNKWGSQKRTKEKHSTENVEEKVDYNYNMPPQTKTLDFIQVEVPAETIQEVLRNRLNQIYSLIETGDGNVGIKELQDVQNEARDYGLDQLVQEIDQRISKIAMLSHLLYLLQSNDRMKIDDVCNILKISKAKFIEIFLDWTKKNQLNIEGEYLVINKETDLNKAIKDLDGMYAQWENREKLKQGKI
jgi:hypothetical protein